MRLQQYIVFFSTCQVCYGQRFWYMCSSKHNQYVLKVLKIIRHGSSSEQFHVCVQIWQICLELLDWKGKRYTPTPTYRQTFLRTDTIFKPNYVIYFLGINKLKNSYLKIITLFQSSQSNYILFALFNQFQYSI